MSSRREAPPTGRASRLPAPPPLFRPATGDAPEPGLVALRRLLLHRWPGRALLGGIAIKLIAVLIEWTAGASVFTGLLGTIARLGYIVGGAVVAWWIFQRARTRLLWRVRERLLVSYLFIGVVPALLIAAFFLFGIALLVVSVSAYLFMTGVNGVVADARVIAQAAADELERSDRGTSVQSVLDFHVNRAQSRYRRLSLVTRATAGRRPPATRDRAARGALVTSVVRAGPWSHLSPPDHIPAGVGQGDFEGILSDGGTSDEPLELIARAVARSRSQEWSIVADVPIDEAVWTAMEETSGIQMVDLAPATDSTGASSVVTQTSTATATSWVRYISTRTGGKWVAEPRVFVPIKDWLTQETAGVTARVRVAPGDMFRRLASAQGRGMAETSALIFGLITLLFLVVEGAALAMGWALARSITGNVHALFQGTERLRLGDLGPPHSHPQPRSARRARRIVQRDERQHRDAARAGGGEAAPGGGAAHRAGDPDVAAAATRDADGRRRARRALCAGARSGRRLLRFLPLGPRRLGLLVADVAGKGTSAALYMAELKGLMLSLSQIHESPRQLLIEVNRIIAANLDSRSFITMTYAVVDLERRTLTYARAGHTPLVHRDGRRRRRRRGWSRRAAWSWACSSMAWSIASPSC